MSEPYIIICPQCNEIYYTESKPPFTMWESKGAEPSTVDIFFCASCGYLRIKIICPIEEGSRHIEIPNLYALEDIQEQLSNGGGCHL